jgi:hypothetical protein
MQRLVIIYNQQSSKFCRIQSDILDRLPSGWTGYQIDNTLDVDANARALARFVRAGDRLISAGGDGTATICVNAAMLSDIELELGVLPYGNFNDAARCFGALSLDQLSAADAPTELAYPLELRVDGRRRRYGLCYITLGMLAESTRIFDEHRVRSRLHRGRSISFSLRSLIKWYLRHHRQRFLPRNYRFNTGVVKNTTDMIAFNTTSAAGVLRNHTRFYRESRFLVNAVDLSTLTRVIWVIGRAVAWQTPGAPATALRAEFSRPTTLEAQSEGEYFTLHGVSKLEIVKAKQPIRMLTSHVVK